MDLSLDGIHPLEGITVVDLTQVIAGPFASMLLGDMGADVIKIEAPGRGDRTRRSIPAPEYFDTVNRNKQSIAIDLKSSEGQAIAKALLEDADVFLENTKPGRLSTFDLTYESVRDVNPTIIQCSISGFGTESPYEGIPAMDMVIQAMSGIMSLTGEADGPPTWSGLPSGDLAAAMYAVQAITSALFARERGLIDTELIEVPMLDAAISWLGPRAGYTFGTGEPFPRMGSRHPSNEPAGLFACQDGYIVLIAFSEELWADFCAAIDREDLLKDDRFQGRRNRVANRAALLDEIEPILAARSAEYWIETLRDHEVPAGPIYDTKTVWDDDHVSQRELRQRMNRPGRSAATVIDHPVSFTSLAAGPRIPPPELGDSTDSLLQAHGYRQAEIERLRQNGIVE